MFRRDRRATLALAAVLASIACPPASSAQENVQFGVEMRYRPETRRELFLASDVGPLQYLRTRLRGEVGQGGLGLRLVMQDARILGATSSTGVPAGDTNLGVHEAFMRYQSQRFPDLSLQAGRFEMAYGNERVIGPSNWTNTGARFDGARVSLTYPDWRLDLFRAKILERLLPHPANSDWDLYGLYLTTAAKWDLFFLLDYDGQRTLGHRNLERFTLGAYSARPFAGNLDYIANAALQLGTITGTDISAYLLTLELGVNGEDQSWRGAVGFDLASGDDPTDSDFQAYNNLYYTGHKFRGIMDQFIAPNAASVFSETAGLLDLYGRFGYRPATDWWAGADFHYFRFAQDPSVTNDQRSVGAELDAVVRCMEVKSLTTEVGGAIFFPSEDTFGSNADATAWAYLQVTATLP